MLKNISSKPSISLLLSLLLHIMLFSASYLTFPLRSSVINSINNSIEIDIVNIDKVTDINEVKSDSTETVENNELSKTDKIPKKEDKDERKKEEANTKKINTEKVDQITKTKDKGEEALLMKEKKKENNKMEPKKKSDSNNTDLKKLSDNKNTSFHGISVTEVDFIKRKIQKVWYQPTIDSISFKIIIKLKLKKNGYLDEAIQTIAIVGTNGEEKSVALKDISGQQRKFAESAIRAITYALPFDTLPQEKYKAWQEIDIVFSTEGGIS